MMKHKSPQIDKKHEESWIVLIKAGHRQEKKQADLLFSCHFYRTVSNLLLSFFSAGVG